MKSCTQQVKKTSNSVPTPEAREALRELLAPVIDQLVHDAALMAGSLNGPDPEHSLSLLVDVARELPGTLRSINSGIPATIRRRRRISHFAGRVSRSAAETRAAALQVVALLDAKAGAADLVSAADALLDGAGGLRGNAFQLAQVQEHAAGTRRTA